MRAAPRGRRMAGRRKGKKTETRGSDSREAARSKIPRAIVAGRPNAALPILRLSLGGGATVRREPRGGEKSERKEEDEERSERRIGTERRRGISRRQPGGEGAIPARNTHTRTAGDRPPPRARQRMNERETAHVM